MQLHQLRYILEVNRTGSISKAAENLYLTQPNLSNAILELEKELKIKIFDRTNRGVTATDEGILFLSYADNIVNQVNNLEQLFTGHKKKTASLRFAWSIQTGYVPFALINQLPRDALVNIQLTEGTHLEVIDLLVRRNIDIGAILIPVENIGEYKRLAKKHNLVLKTSDSIESFILMSAKSKLAAAEIIHEHMLADGYIQMVYRPAGIFDLPNSTAPKTRGIRLLDRNIYFSDRATLLEILSACPDTYVQSPFVDPERLKQHRLVARPHTIHDHRYMKLVLYHDQPLNKEMEWLLAHLDETADRAQANQVDPPEPDVGS